MKNDPETIANFFRDVFSELVELALDKENYGNSEFDRGYIAGLKSVFYMISDYATTFEVDLNGLSSTDIDLNKWLKDPRGYVRGRES